MFFLAMATSGGRKRKGYLKKEHPHKDCVSQKSDDLQRNGRKSSGLNHTRYDDKICLTLNVEEKYVCMSPRERDPRPSVSSRLNSAATRSFQHPLHNTLAVGDMVKTQS